MENDKWKMENSIGRLEKNTPKLLSNPAINSLLNERIAAGDFPSAVYVITERGELVLADALGLAVVEPYRITATLDTVYDLASLTKPLITALLCARRIDLGELTLDSSISHYLPEFERPDKHMITVRHLLTHTSGLPAWRPLYILAEGESDRTISVIASQELEAKPGTKVIYSDLGFICLGLILERLTGQELIQLAQEEIFSTLQLKATIFKPDLAMQTGIAACETGNVYEQENCIQAGLGEYEARRKTLIWGQVHDGNAYFLGGAAGHAGLFSTARETSLLAQQYLPQFSLLIKQETCNLARQNLTKGLNEARSLGWQLAETSESTAGSALPPDSFGHNGFTGTSCWIDPRNERVFILLTNRTHAHKTPFVNINSVRRQFHSLAVEALKR
jgi:CubicO group peptidase (beta-lactamase class C family)